MPLFTFPLNMDSGQELHPGSLAELQGAASCTHLAVHMGLPAWRESEQNAMVPACRDTLQKKCRDNGMLLCSCRADPPGESTELAWGTALLKESKQTQGCNLEYYIQQGYHSDMKEKVSQTKTEKS